MGMDSYIYKFKKSDYDNFLKYKENYKKLEDEYHLFCDSLRKKYNVKSLEGVGEYLSEDERETIDNFSKSFEKLEDYDYDYEEIKYWRKPYKFHDFITSNFLLLGEDDNCHHIPLIKENIKLIIDKLKNDPLYFNCNMWDSNDTEQALELFSEIYENYTDEFVYTYYAWY